MKQIMTFLLASLWIAACSTSVSTQTDFAYFPTDLPKSDIIRSEKQNFHTQVVAKGLKNPWGMAFFPMDASW